MGWLSFSLFLANFLLLPSSSLAVCLTLLFLLHLRPLLFPPTCNFVAPVIAQSADQTKEGPSPSPSPPPKRKNPRPPDRVRRDFPLFSSFDYPPLHSYAKIEHGLFLFSFAPSAAALHKRGRREEAFMPRAALPCSIIASPPLSPSLRPLGLQIRGRARRRRRRRRRRAHKRPSKRNNRMRRGGGREGGYTTPPLSPSSQFMSRGGFRRPRGGGGRGEEKRGCRILCVLVGGKRKRPLSAKISKSEKKALSAVASLLQPSYHSLFSPSGRTGKQVLTECV